MRGPGSLRDPWKYVSDYWPELPVTVGKVDDDLNGYTTWSRTHGPHIYIDKGLDEIGLRCTLRHELTHVEFGMPDKHHEADDEHRVRVFTARWLLPDVDMVRAVLDDNDMEDAAKMLWVTPDVLLDRLMNLSQIETHTIHGRREVKAYSITDGARSPAVPGAAMAGTHFDLAS